MFARDRDPVARYAPGAADVVRRLCIDDDSTGRRSAYNETGNKYAFTLRARQLRPDWHSTMYAMFMLHPRRVCLSKNSELAVTRRRAVSTVYTDGLMFAGALHAGSGRGPTDVIITEGRKVDFFLWHRFATVDISCFWLKFQPSRRVSGIVVEFVRLDKLSDA